MIFSAENKMAEEKADVKYISPMDTSEIHLQTQKCMQNTNCKQTGVPDQWKRIYRTTQNLVG